MTKKKITVNKENRNKEGPGENNRKFQLLSGNEADQVSELVAEPIILGLRNGRSDEVDQKGARRSILGSLFR